MEFFKETTTGNAIVMGRRTWLTLKGPLKNRVNIVLTREANFAVSESVMAMKSVDEVLDFAQAQENHLFVIGGAKVYESFLRHIQRWIVTEVPIAVEAADTFMPKNFLEGFEMFELRQLDEGLRVKFYERASP